ncbi:hypothetical protein B0H63DRAFT_473765 [Podospora didyma]|uniref:Uncharacterized protein n=1 Tax=Podospora didyma TaxID=330526 RepID=A0AAE0NQW3_9PEZI|nr:hypothetical protein B0H63DRAFT_473765 [Podospora didyma]
MTPLYPVFLMIKFLIAVSLAIFISDPHPLLIIEGLSLLASIALPYPAPPATGVRPNRQWQIRTIVALFAIRRNRRDPLCVDVGPVRA